MHKVYVDEAGDFRGEHMSVVVGVIIEECKLELARLLLRTTLDEYVPQRLRPGFLFHAKKLYNGNVIRETGWKIKDRSALIRAVASIPRQICAAISIGKIRNDSQSFDFRKYSKADIRHGLAFHACLVKANQYVRDWSVADAVVIAEDIPERRRLLAITLKVPVVKFSSMDAPFFNRWTKIERQTGVFTQNCWPGDIDRIKDPITFRRKGEEPLLAIADACAFCLRRYLSAQPYGQQLVAAMADGLEWDDFQSAQSHLLWSYDPYRVYPKSKGITYLSPVFRSYSTWPTI